MAEVKCNNCGWQGQIKELVYDLGGYWRNINRCPKCRKIKDLEYSTLRG